MKNSADVQNTFAVNECTFESVVPESGIPATCEKVKEFVVLYAWSNLFESDNHVLVGDEEFYLELLDIKRNNLKWVTFDMDIWSWLKEYPCDRMLLMN